MKILYGVQGTGNGHLTRARGMVKHLARPELQVDFVFTGRKAEKYFSMEPFGDWRCLDGLTFSVKKGKIKPLGTLFNSKPLQLLKDIKQLPVDDYDLIISDFEPVTAWAARKRNKHCLGIGHQYAFDFPIPKQGDSPLTRFIMRQFAPTTHSVGMHWYHFNQPILPPIVDVVEELPPVEEDKIIVYLPFELPQHVVKLIKDIPYYHFLYYGEFAATKTEGNITFNPISREGFQRDLARSAGVISNAGFELASESISLGKKIFAKPLHGQMEQISNALALEQLGLGKTAKHLTTAVITDWLDNFTAKHITYPDVAERIVDWILAGDLDNKGEMVKQLWDQCDAHGLATFQPYDQQQHHTDPDSVALKSSG